MNISDEQMNDIKEVSPETALKRLLELANGDDQETTHVEADRIPLGVIKGYGHPEIVAAFGRLTRWYA